jgi:predicted nucleic acid-binding protein
VLDSATIAAIFFPDQLSTQVEHVLPRYDEFHTVDLAYAEIGNLALKRVRIFKENRAQVMKSLKAALEFIRNDCKIVESEEVLQQAVKFGLDNNITTYDAIFIVAAKRLGTKVLSVDEKLFHKMQLQEPKKSRDLVMLPV